MSPRRPTERAPTSFCRSHVVRMATMDLVSVGLAHRSLDAKVAASALPDKT